MQKQLEKYAMHKKFVLLHLNFLIEILFPLTSTFLEKNLILDNKFQSPEQVFGYRTIEVIFKVDKSILVASLKWLKVLY